MKWIISILLLAITCSLVRDGLLPLISFAVSFFICRSLSMAGKAIGQPISPMLPWHLHKQNTPTMGGIGIIFSFFAVTGAAFIKKLLSEGDLLNLITEFSSELFSRENILENGAIEGANFIDQNSVRIQIEGTSNELQSLPEMDGMSSKDALNPAPIDSNSEGIDLNNPQGPLNLTNLSSKELTFLFLRSILRRFIIKNIQLGTGWIYLVIIASFLTGIADDLHKIWHFNNKGLSKLDKFWMMLASIGSIILIKFGYWVEGCLFFAYLIATAFSILSKDWILNRFYALGIGFCWMIFGTIKHAGIFGTSLLFLPLGCSIMSFGLLNTYADEIGIIHLLLVIFLGISCNQNSFRKVTALLIALFSDPICRFLFSGSEIQIGLFLPAILTLIIILSSAIFDLTDGLDGLLAIIASIIFLTLGFIFPEITILPNLIGAILGFAMLNLKPASIFMGDCGSLALGSAFGAIMMALWLGDFGIKVPMKELAVLSIVLNLVPLVNFLSVALNITLAKFKLPRFFFAPIHHEIEKRFNEETAVYSLWIITIISSSIVLLNRGFKVAVLFTKYFP